MGWKWYIHTRYQITYWVSKMLSLTETVIVAIIGFTLVIVIPIVLECIVLTVIAIVSYIQEKQKQKRGHNYGKEKH